MCASMLKSALQITINIVLQSLRGIVYGNVICAEPGMIIGGIVAAVLVLCRAKKGAKDHLNEKSEISLSFIFFLTTAPILILTVFDMLTDERYQAIASSIERFFSSIH